MADEQGQVDKPDWARIMATITGLCFAGALGGGLYGWLTDGNIGRSVAIGIMAGSIASIFLIATRSGRRT